VNAFNEDRSEAFHRLDLDVDGLIEMIDALLREGVSESDTSRSGSDEASWRAGRFVIPMRPVAVGAVLVALACMTALVLVATAENANALATIALALAVLAFVVQIMVFIYQSLASNHATLQNEQIFTETRALLTEVRTAANSTETLVREQFADVLKAVIDGSPGGQREEMLSTLRDELALPSPSLRLSARELDLIRERTIALRRAQAQFSDFPSEDDGVPVLAHLRVLSDSARERVRELAEDERSMIRAGTMERTGKAYKAEDQELEDVGLAGAARVTFGGVPRTVARLTDSGRIAASLLLATGDVPDYAKGFLERLPAIEVDGSATSKGP
jgi:hypothetical protein